jgi:hypothetical protein
MADERKTERMGRLDPLAPAQGEPMPPVRAPGRSSRKVTETQPIGSPVDSDDPTSPS